MEQDQLGSLVRHPGLSVSGPINSGLGPKVSPIMSMETEGKMKIKQCCARTCTHPNRRLLRVEEHLRPFAGHGQEPELGRDVRVIHVPHIAEIQAADHKAVGGDRSNHVRVFHRQY